jgi:hypothetical protein
MSDYSASPRYNSSPHISTMTSIKKLSLRSCNNGISSSEGSSSRSDSGRGKKWSIRKFLSRKKYHNNSDSNDSDNDGDNDGDNNNNNEIHCQAVTEMKVKLCRRKSDINAIENACKDVIRKKQHIALGSSVNHVWNVYDIERNVSGYYKSGRNGNLSSGYLENIVYEIAVQFSVEKYFAPTEIRKISPRSQRNMSFKDLLPNSPRNSGSSESSSDKNTGKKKRRSLADHTDNTPIELSFQTKVPGIEVKYIKDEMKTSLLAHFSKNYPFLGPDNIKRGFDKCFIKAAIITMMFGFWDGHARNVILNGDGFRFFDNARSLPHSNNLIVWGDKMRLPYYTHFISEALFHNPMSKDDTKVCTDVLKKFLTGFKHFKHYLSSSAGKKSTRMIPKDWFDKSLVISSFKERIDRLAKWVTLDTENKTLADLMYYVFPMYRFCICLKYISNLTYNNNNNNNDNNNGRWRLAMSTVGKDDDMLYLVNVCREKGYSPIIVYKYSQHKDFSPNNFTQMVDSGYFSGGNTNNNTKNNSAKFIESMMYNSFCFDFKECSNSADWVVSFLNQYAITMNLNLFGINNYTLPNNSIEMGFLPAIREKLFGSGYFLTFYSQNTDVKCSLCYIDENGIIRIQDIKIKYSGKVRFHLGISKYLDSLEEFSEWLCQFEDRELNTKGNPDIFIRDYADYYKNDYIIKMLDSIGVSYINTDEYDLTSENLQIIKEYEKEYLDKDGMFVYINKTENNICNIFNIKYCDDGKIMSDILDVDLESNIIVGDRIFQNIKEFQNIVK